MSNKLRLITYTAGGIEHCSNKEMKSWREEIAERLVSPDLTIYDPVKMEAEKVGKPSGEQVEYIKGLKQGGHWNKFYEEMHKIWMSNISPNQDLLGVFNQMRLNKYMVGVYEEDLKKMGDYQAVLVSDFIIVYMPKDIKTIGTIFEIVIAFLFNIPIYLILPDSSKTEANSSLLYGVMLSKGETFYNINEACKFIREKYNLKEILKPEDKSEENK
jgi:hypothetical protein